MGHLDQAWGDLGAIWSRLGEPKTLIFLRFFNTFWVLEGWKFVLFRFFFRFVFLLICCCFLARLWSDFGRLWGVKIGHFWHRFCDDFNSARLSWTKSVSRAPKSVPRAPKSTPRASQERSNSAQEHPKSAQERPKTAPRAPKSAQRAPKCVPRAAQERPGGSQDASQGAPGSSQGPC